jgi:hypothetical protein
VYTQYGILSPMIQLKMAQCAEEKKDIGTKRNPDTSESLENVWKRCNIDWACVSFRISYPSYNFS